MYVREYIKAMCINACVCTYVCAGGYERVHACVPMYVYACMYIHVHALVLV